MDTSGNLYKLIVVLVFFIANCTNENNQKEKSKKLINFSIQRVGIKKYQIIRKSAQDSLKSWSDNKLGIWDNSENLFNLKLDTVLCFNLKQGRLIGAILTQYFSKDNLCGGLLYFYGEKINGSWYFWDGASIFLPKSMNPNLKKGKAMSFDFLHQQAILNIFGSYYKMSDKEIEAWFEGHFEGIGWGKFEERYQNDWILDGNKIDNKEEYFKYIHKRKGLSNWIRKSYEDSLKHSEASSGKKLTREEQREISYYFTRKITNGK